MINQDVARCSNPRGFMRTHIYDRANGALIKLEEPDGTMLRFTNNADGLRDSKTNGLGYETQYSYMANRSMSAAASDNVGRVSRETDPLGQTTDIDYGQYDQPTLTLDKRGNPTTRSYYATTDAATGAVAGKRKALRATVNGTPNVLLATWTYDADTTQPTFGQRRQKVEYIDPANPARQRITDYVYGSNGLNLQRRTVRGATSGGSVTTTYSYDALGRRTSQTLRGPAHLGHRCHAWRSPRVMPTIPGWPGPNR